MAQRAYVAGKFAIDVDGIAAGWISSAEGGHATAEVVNEKIGPDLIVHKHIGGVKYEDITVSCGTGMSKGFYGWIKDSFDHKHSRKGGAIIACDYDFKERSRLTWQDGLITEIGLPALDAASKDAAKMTIKIAPQTTRITTTAGGAQVSPSKYSLGGGKQKTWSPANFRVAVQGCDTACKAVNKVDALALKQKVTEVAVGEHRDYEKEPSSIEIPNLVLTVNESAADEFFKWHEDFVIKGNNDQSKERTGSIEYLSPNLADVLFTLNFHGLGIFKVTPDKLEAGSDTIRKVKVEMYCENVEFNFSGSAAWA